LNHLTLTASVVGRQALRYTPAGLPVLDLTLHHESEVVQEGAPRRVSVELRGRAVGSVVPSVEGLDIGASRDFSGFLGAQRNGRGVVFHLLEVGEPRT
jgi:primosomal replication protein N